MEKIQKITIKIVIFACFSLICKFFKFIRLFFKRFHFKQKVVIIFHTFLHCLYKLNAFIFSVENVCLLLFKLFKPVHNLVQFYTDFNMFFDDFFSIHFFPPHFHFFAKWCIALYANLQPSFHCQHICNY